ncbi:hypothetical protein OSTOST_14948, partial [Ostertagia ostertagi]
NRSIGLRSGGSNDGSGSSAAGGATGGASSTVIGCPRPQSLPSANTHQQNRKSNKDVEENNNVRGAALSPDHDTSSRHSDSSKSQGSQRLKRTESSISSESQKSTGSGSGRGSANVALGRENIGHTEKRGKQPTPPKKEPKKKVMTEREVMDVAAGLRALKIGAVAKEIEDWISCGFADDTLAESIGSALCQHAIEGGGGRTVAKLCGALRDSPSAFALYRGLLSSVSQYFECRDRLRADHFRMWISFLAFVADLYCEYWRWKRRWELVNFVFQVFDYLLRAPILETLKIEEHCCQWDMISNGNVQTKLSLLKDLIRDAFIDVSEPWARKMILLLLELGASGWKLPAEANEYYFQQTTN